MQYLNSDEVAAQTGIQPTRVHHYAKRLRIKPGPGHTRARAQWPESIVGAIREVREGPNNGDPRLASKTPSEYRRVGNVLEMARRTPKGERAVVARVVLTEATRNKLAQLLNG